VVRFYNKRAQSVDQPDQIARQLEDVVGLDLFGSISLPVTAHVGCDRTESCVAERSKLMTPRIPGLRKSMAENDQRSRATFHVMHANAVGLYEVMSNFPLVFLSISHY